MGNVCYVVVDGTSGAVVETVTVPESMFPLPIKAGQQIVVVLDRMLPKHSQYVVDLQMLDGEITEVDHFSDIVLQDELPITNPGPSLDTLKEEKISEIDGEFAAQMEAVRGPLYAIHTEKRRQAEAGGGSLVADEADRLAILANAAAQDEEIASIERERRRVKSLIRSARSTEDLEWIMNDLREENKGIPT